jgi:hypothetical protein
MNQEKEQKVVVLTSLNPQDKMLILNGIKIAVMFKKELCLVYNHKKQDIQKQVELKSKLHEYIVPVKNEIPELKISTLITTNPVATMPEILADDYEAIFLITGISQFKYYSKAVVNSPVPFLFVNEHSTVSNFSKVILPVDLREGNSDSALWCSYFGRFNHAELIVVAASEKGKHEQKAVAKNVVLTKKLFQKFNINHKIYKGQRSSWRIAFEALEFAHTSGSDLFVILGSRSATPLDYLIGLPERKIIKMAGGLPVMYINPRRDNYILCD